MSPSSTKSGRGRSIRLQPDLVSILKAWRKRQLLERVALGADFRIWEPVAARLGDAFGYVLFDKRGHGLSELGAAPPTMHGQDYAALQAMVKEATEVVAKETPESINALEGRHMEFHIADRKVPYTAENFLLSFSMPNFYFHSTTTYDILRMKGVPLGKRDFMGKMRIKTA